MNQILYDMGPLDNCQIASLENLKGLTHPSNQDPSLYMGSSTQKLKKISVS